MRRLLSSLVLLVAACETGDPALTAPGGGTPAVTDPPDGGGADGGVAPAKSGPGEVLTAKNDNGRTGANLAEKVLDVARARTMAPVATLAVDGELYAQPLVVADVVTSAGTKSLVLVATMNDSVYAFDVDAPDGAPPVWHAGAARELGEPGASQRNVRGPNGILSTPVVDRARGLVWAVARDCSKTETTAFDRCGVPTEVPRCRERLFAIDLGTGEVRDAVDVEGSVVTDGKTLAFDASVQWNRPALLLAGDAVYVAFGSGPNGGDHEEDYEYHGWLFRYDAASPKMPPAVFNATPESSGGSVWQAGAGPAADDEHVYFVTANVVLGCSTHAPAGFPAEPASAEDSVVRLPHGYATADLRDAGAKRQVEATSPLGTVASYAGARVYADTRPYTADAYSGTVFQFTSSGDCGFGSSGPTLIPGSRDLVVSTKGGLLYLLDRDTMEPRQAPLSPFDRLPLQGDHTLYIHSWWGIPMLPGSLAFFRPDDAHGLVYGWPKGDVLRSFRYDYAGHTLAADRTADVPVTSQGGYLSISSDGARAGTAVVWATLPGEAGGGRAMALDAITLETLWAADTPAFSKFTPPTVARGRLFVPSGRAVVVYAPR